MFDFSQISDACVKCGRCIQVCTIYSVNRDEATSPRGFLDLVGAYSRGELGLDKGAKRIFESCFLCTNCVEVCPKNLRVDTAIEFIRADIAKKHGIAWYKRAFFFLLRHRWAMDFCAKLGFVFQSCAFKLRQGGMSARFSLPMIKKGRFLPSAKRKSFLNSHPKIIPASTQNPRKIGLFIGCMANYAYTEVGESIIAIARALNLELNLMKKQACCGAPAYFTGDLATAKELAKKNIAYFESLLNEGGLEAIIIPEATCSAMIKVDYEHLFEAGSQWQNRLKVIKDRVFMATEFLNNFTNLKELLKSHNGLIEDVKITYHDPCHARKMQGIWREPREILSQKFIINEMSDSNACCGFGGVSLQSERRDLVEAVGAKKAQMVGLSGAEIVSAECSACRMQISDALVANGVNARFKNPLELIAQSLKND
ncbi:(Fe-S)-binding protein [Campylobacter sp. 19-13652]|uniref:(Fe-S)-binding protein n=1 Tax=Campylobacter sp. 19-13652 TaxID=2840180 RepID=UPI001C749451|nr:(Fe-S)-binding protein [Campylobacter sp. 19-13652]BCX79001.1 glycolate oxidase iron-sulfur subunit [Campylobacter sp. 19-13652]